MDSFALIIFGITSNLAQTKLIPALYDIAEKDLLPENTVVLGIARSPKEKEQFREEIKKAIKNSRKTKEDVLGKLINSFYYLDGKFDNPEFYNHLDDALSQLQHQGFVCKNRIFYLATYPNLYGEIFKNLQDKNLNNQENGWVRLMIEKPIGEDLKSAQKLNTLLLQYFTEDQIYRIDHYLAKENLQNILTFRFGNGIFEHLMNKDHIDHIQITVAEDKGIGTRGGYYDQAGALKDVGQNHVLQILALTTMDAPKEFSNKAITQERLKVIESLKAFPENIVFGQYEGYLEEGNVSPNSKTNTYFALKTEINNDRFRHVPIYIRAGKNLARNVAEVAIVFKVPENRILKDKTHELVPNILFYRIQPNEGIILKILVKKPGNKIATEPTYMQFCYKQLSTDLSDAYEKVVLDAIGGDQTFFNDAKEVEAQWKFIDAYNSSSHIPFSYKPQSWGPEEANLIIKGDKRMWLEPSIDFCKL